MVYIYWLYIYICICICICMYIYNVYLYTYTHVYRYVCVYIYTCIDVSHVHMLPGIPVSMRDKRAPGACCSNKDYPASCAFRQRSSLLRFQWSKIC